MTLDEQLKHKVAAYAPAPQTLDGIRTTPILLIAGISGAGKNTIIQQLLSVYPNEYRSIVTYTTRAPRQNHGVMEQEGVDYRFIDFETAGQMLDNSAFLEAKIVHFDNIYGTGIAELEETQKQGKIALADIDVQGVEEYISLGMNAKPVFLLPPSYDIWWERLMSRYTGTPDPDDLSKRMETALAELEHALANPHFYLVINNSLSKTVDLVYRISHNEAIEPQHDASVAVARHIVDQLKAHTA